MELTKEDFISMREENLTFKEIGEFYNLSEYQVAYRSKNWGLNYAKKKQLNEQFFSLKTKAAYYWAGFLAADGYIESNRSRIGLALQAQDRAHLVKFKEAIESEHDICPFMNNTAYRIRFNSILMCKDLNTIFNITTRKTFTYSMPIIEEQYLLLEFLRGYIEGDGNLNKVSSGKVILSLCSANKEFLIVFKNTCSKLLYAPITQEITLKVNPKGSVYNICFNVADSFELINLLYKNSTNKTRLDRKYSIASLILR